MHRVSCYVGISGSGHHQHLTATPYAVWIRLYTHFLLACVPAEIKGKIITWHVISVGVSDFPLPPLPLFISKYTAFLFFSGGGQDNF